MKLQLVEGCICNSLTIDDKEEIDLSDVERQAVIDKITDWLKEHPEELNVLLQHLIPLYGKCECDEEPCECCGDFIETTTWYI